MLFVTPNFVACFTHDCIHPNVKLVTKKTELRHDSRVYMNLWAKGEKGIRVHILQENKGEWEQLYFSNESRFL